MAFIQLAGNKARLTLLLTVVATFVAVRASHGQSSDGPVQLPQYQFSDDSFLGDSGSSPPAQLASFPGGCQSCGQLAGDCRCGAGTRSGSAGCNLGGCPNGGCQFSPGCFGTNLFWCSPYPVPYVEPCMRPLCDECMADAAPTFYASAELLPLMRDQNDEVLYQTVGVGGLPALESGSFKTEFDAGARITGGVTLTECYRAEISYLGAYEWGDYAAERNVDPNGGGDFGDLQSLFSNFGIPAPIEGLDYNSFASIETRATFNSLEANLRRRYVPREQLWPAPSHCCVANSFLVGLRYLNIDEEFGYLTGSTLPAGGSINQALINTNNDLYGVQIGMLSQFLLRDYGWVDFEIKGGIFHNEASMRSAYDYSDLSGGNASSFVGIDDRDRTTFLGELSLTYNHQFTRHLSCRVGYNAFWLTGVALASQNLNANPELLALGPAQLDHSGEIVYHGPSIGLVFGW